MIVDHLITRTGIRSLGLLIGAIVPMALSYFCYMLAYKESPFFILLDHLPLIIQLLNTDVSTLGHNDTGLLDLLRPFHQHLISEASISNISPSAAATHPSTTPIASAVSSALSAAKLTLKDTADVAAESIVHDLPSKVAHSLPSPIVNVFIAVLKYLDRHGYRDPKNIPGFQYLVALQPLMHFLKPVLNFLSSHRTLTAIVTMLHLWMAAELVFYILFLKKLKRLQTVDNVIQGIKSKAEREEIFQRCLETVEDGDGAKKWVECWFDTSRKKPARFEDIGRQNMVCWFVWALWATSVEQVTKEELLEAEQMIDTIERVKLIKFADGFNPNVKCIRPNLDPVVASHRPLIYYLLVWVANTLANVAFRALGFKGYTEQGSSHSSKLPNGTGRCPPDLAYWYRSPSSPQNEIPLVFIQGVGIGLAQYIYLIIALACISRPLILIEVPYISNKLVQTDCMTPDETYLAIKRILNRHSYQKATFMGHSLGTMLCAAVCRASSANTSDSIVAGLVLVDPICFLTHHSIARNFAYRIPTTACQLVIDLFASREIGTSWYIMRRFCWYQCIMFPIAWANRHQKPLPFQGKLSPVLPEKTRIFLSRKDSLLDMDKVAEYLRTQVGLVEGREEGELVMVEEMEHGEFMLHPSWIFRIVKAASES
ncbi:hypothetical protein BX616_001050 [Lobosporangium transversale]|uniref:AB hydrolase-1 domain-containing protein n=1 Tax=Lobosporangium transversale TaxID=64571 RepID=A0A1Y2G885_9FUNG|nr:hypothetical protein BCR41DRAFT_342309 [Lobosporangium transversale]KAF9917426.1 hypothetical protein BX616_001050 [Lobosporangium transversale]ORZ04076.1 hypothetical protein BCR41DRAFT_342309 [Lobosporangium transversale]|eukprot:XP_021876353.1 hypothetical protein BCR41DRAFT_342309 [Lobosporangium transversale]